MYSPFPRRKPRMAAQCKHPGALNPGLSQRKLMWTKEKTKEIAASPYSPTDAMKGGMGRNKGSPHGPSASASALHSSSCSWRSRSSHSDASLPSISSLSSAGRTIFPTSVAMRNLNTTSLHLGSAKSSCAFHRNLPPPVSSQTSFYSTFCCFLHLGHPFRSCSLVCLGWGHHQHWAVCLALVQCRYSPVRAGPVFSW